MNIKLLFPALALSLLFQDSQAQTQKKQISNYNLTSKNFVATGNWRGVFKIKPGVEVPFNFDITGKDAINLNLIFLNAEERFSGGHVNKTSDSLFVKLDQFDNELAFKIEGDSLVGVLRKQDKSGRPLAVVAERGKITDSNQRE